MILQVDGFNHTLKSRSIGSPSMTAFRYFFASKPNGAKDQKSTDRPFAVRLSTDRAAALLDLSLIQRLGALEQ